MELSELARPFKADEIEWRVAQSGVKNGQPWAQVLAYVTSRAIFDRLDEVCGIENWRNEYREWQGNAAVLCGISIRVGDEWITKWDGAENTKVEEIKGGFSAANKRAAVPWGIGRYLYGLGVSWAVIAENGAHRGVAKGKAGAADVYFKWDAPALPAWALPGDAVPAKKIKLPPLDEAQTEKAYKAWKAVVAGLVALEDDGIVDPSKINAEWFKLESNIRSAITAWGKKLEAVKPKTEVV